MQVKNRFNGSIIGEFSIGNKANLSEADLSEANLSEANLSKANLSGADLRWANLPSPTMLLLANWGNVYLSNELCIELMRYDAANHPKPELFNKWANGGDCPYNGIKWQRCANFQERKDLWSPGPAKSALELAMMLLKEKCVWQS